MKGHDSHLCIGCELLIASFNLPEGADLSATELVETVEILGDLSHAGRISLGSRTSTLMFSYQAPPETPLATALRAGTPEQA